MAVELIPDSMMCATCRVPLTKYLPAGEPDPVYVHIGAADHEVVPVPLDWSTADVRCDFCSVPVPNTAAVVHCEPFTFVHHDGVVHHDNGEWMACPTCVEMVLAGEWTKLTDFSLLSFEAYHGRPPSDPRRIRELHREVARRLVVVEPAT